MSPILSMAYCNVYIKKLHHRHPTIMFLSDVDDILFVANNIEEVKHVRASVEEIGRTLGLRAHPDKTKQYHWGGQEVGKIVRWWEQPVKVRAPYFD